MWPVGSPPMLIPGNNVCAYQVSSSEVEGFYLEPFLFFFFCWHFSQTSIGRYVAQISKDFVVLIFGYKTGNFHPKTHSLKI